MTTYKLPEDYNATNPPVPFGFDIFSTGVTYTWTYTFSFGTADASDVSVTNYYQPGEVQVTNTPGHFTVGQFTIVDDTLHEKDETFSIHIHGQLTYDPAIFGDKSPDAYNLDYNLVILDNDPKGSHPDVLFDDSNNNVDFNNLTDSQQTALQNGANPYDAEGGNDIVTLPDPANYASLSWDHTRIFDGGAGNDTVVYKSGQFGGLTKSTDSLFSFNGAAGTTTFGDYTFKSLATDQGFAVQISNGSTGEVDKVQNVEFFQHGSGKNATKLPLAKIDIEIDRTSQSTGELTWFLNGQQQGGPENIYFDPTLVVAADTYTAIYRLNGGTKGSDHRIELSDSKLGQSDLPNAEYVQIHGGNSSQYSAACFVGPKGDQALGQLFKLLDKLTKDTPHVSTSVSNHLTTHSDYLMPTTPTSEGNLHFSASSTGSLTSGLTLNNSETFVRLPIPITVHVNDNLQQPTLHLTPDGSTPIDDGGSESLQLSLDNFTTTLDRDIIVHMRVTLDPGMETTDVGLVDQSGHKIAIHWSKTDPDVGTFDVTINHKLGVETEFDLKANGGSGGDVDLLITGYSSHIPAHGSSKASTSTPPGQALINVLNPSVNEAELHILGSPERNFADSAMDPQSHDAVHDFWA